VNNKYAVIDVGTNNVLFLIARKHKNKLDILHRDSNISAFGKKMQDGYLNNTAINKTKRILFDNINYARLFTENIIIVGTSCSRDAKNIDVIEQWLKSKFGLKYNIISGKKEAQLNGLANITEFRKFNNIVMFDVGGGSTEFTYFHNGKMIYNQSLNLGIRRLHNFQDTNFLERVRSTQKALNNLVLPDFKEFKMIGIGGTVTSLSATKFGLQKYDADVVHKSILHNSEIKEMLDLFRRMSNNQIAQLMPFDRYRADIITTGTMIVTEIMDFFGKEDMIVSDRGLQFGILYQEEKDLQEMLS
jgi:exopolyphosphatase/guanosine-5'-triphosphate,3'-diphosphate pyrophosphatase